MPTTPTVILCDDLVAAIKASWEPSGASAVERAYFKRITDEEGAQGLAESIRLAPGERRVVVMPVRYSSQYGTKDEDVYLHEVQVLVCERYTDAGDPPRDWIDERVDFTFDEIVQGLDFRTQPEWNKFLRTLSQDVIVCDLEALAQNKLFWSVVSNVFEETRAA